MAYLDVFREGSFREFFDSLLPDFILAFAFFTALCYAVLSRRFDRQRHAAVVSIVIGLALSVGLISWEYQHDLSIRDLGPVALGLAVIVLAAVIYQAFRYVGGTFAGAGFALGAAILIAWAVGLDWPDARDVLNTVAAVAIIVGLIAFLGHYHRHPPVRAPERRRDVMRVRETRREEADARDMSDRLHRGFRQLRKRERLTGDRSKGADDILLQLRRMLPAEGWLTERMAGLRAKAHRVREGHVARLEGTKEAYDKLPSSAKKQAAGELAGRYRQLIGIDQRLERLDRAVAENEKRIRDLTQLAERYTARHEHQKLHATLKAAEKLQKHNSQLFKIIDRTEAWLDQITKQVAKQAPDPGTDPGTSEPEVTNA